MLQTVNALGIFGSNAYPVKIEVDIAAGMPAISIVGLPDQAVRESRDRIRPAIKNSNLPFRNRRITVNLAPAEIKKEGPMFDLAIAVGLIAASGYTIPAEALSSTYLLGELSLKGEVRRVRGVLPMALFARQTAIKRLVLPKENATEAAVVEGLEVYPVSTLNEAVSFLSGELSLKPHQANLAQLLTHKDDYPFDFSEVAGQEFPKRALEVAVAGGHNILFIGPPGAGKTMLARRIPSILPPLTLEETIDTSRIYSLAGLLPEEGLVLTRPFRNPHHTASDIALIGGGTVPKPGEVSLAHNGVLFLDELPEFDRSSLEVLRQPLEEGEIHISRAKTAVTFPASFMLVAAMNPCPCGNLGHPKKACRCSAGQIARYRGKLSGPLLDRIDLHIEVPPVPFQKLVSNRPAEPSITIRQRVTEVRKIQAERYKGMPFMTNAGLPTAKITPFCPLDKEAADLLSSALEHFELSARSYDRIRKVARTIADMDGCAEIRVEHISEALQYRMLDRKVWL